MKRFFAALSILFLFAGSMAGYAEYCIYSPKACETKSRSVSYCARQSEPTQADRGCRNVGVDDCRPSRTCGKFGDTGGMETCAQKQKCIPRICRLRPPLLADGPNRARLFTPATGEWMPISLQVSFEPASYTRMPKAPPPRGINPCIATSVLRI